MASLLVTAAMMAGRARPHAATQAFAQMTDADLKAVFAYLGTLPKVRNKVPDPVMATPAGQ